MKVQHITVGGNRITRDTNKILPRTREILKDFKVAYTSGRIDFPDTPLTKGWSVRLTAAPEGAIFDIMKGDDIALVNFCSFASVTKPHMMSALTNIISKLSIFKMPATPKNSRFLITMVINPFVLSPDEMQTAGEVELYIYNELYEGWMEKQN